MFAADNVINLVWKTGTVLTYETVLTSPICAFDYETARGVIDFISHWRGFAARVP